MNSFIKSLMNERGINQKELAGILGISPAAVSQWKECSTMNVETLFALSKLFQVTVDELVAEKYTAETPEQKWDRMYNLDGYEWTDLVEEEDDESMLQYLEKLKNTNSRFYNLLYKKMKGNISALESDELSNLEDFYRRDPWQSSYFYDKRCDYPMERMDKWIAETLSEAIGIKNQNAIIWELQRIYQNKKMISFDQVREMQNDDLIYMWYSALTPESKDAFLTNLYRQKVDNAILYELIKRGGRIVYADSDLPQINFDRAELDQFEGEKRPLKNLDDVKKIFWDMYGRYGRASYEQYQIIINKSVIERIEIEHRYKKKDPIKYWEYIKKGVKL